MTTKSRYNPTTRELVERIDQRLDDLVVRLYGEEGDPGDIPAMRAKDKEYNGRIRRLEILFAALACLTGVGTGIVQWLL
jgi:hypothetical protein